jgi:hypothetical protein
MKKYLTSAGKLIAVVLLLLPATRSYSQYGHPSPQYGGHSNYYPHQHDSDITVMPKLIKTNFLYYGFLSTLNQHISIEYDKQMSDDIMILAQVGIISSGVSQVTDNTTAGGAYVEGGMKLFFNPDYTKQGRHGYYTVEGIYLKPEIALSVFTTTNIRFLSLCVSPSGCYPIFLYRWSVNCCYRQTMDNSTLYSA